MATTLNTSLPPQYIPFFRVELLDEQFDDADAELLDVAAHWNEREAVEA